MDKGLKNLLNVLLGILAPVMILEKCSAQGDALWQLGTTRAMALALSLPIACGIYGFATSRKVEMLAVFGLLGTLLTGLVTIYAQTGAGEALRPDTPWWYAAKEALIPMLLCGAVLITAKRPDSLLRAFVYSDSLFDIPAIEKAIAERANGHSYRALLRSANLMLAGSLIVSASANFALALYFLLPVLDLPAAQQAVEYNYAVGKMTWWGYLIIGVPLMATLVYVIRRLGAQLENLTGMGNRIYLKS